MHIILFLIALIAPALAHPHVVVENAAIIQMNEKGEVIAIHQKWSFDKLYSLFATQGLGEKKDGKPTLVELAELAKINTENLNDYDYFTRAKVNDVKVGFEKPLNAIMTHEGEQLTLSFTLPLKNPISLLKSTLILDVFDLEYFVAFQPASGEFISLKEAPKGCETNYKPPKKTDTNALSKLGEAAFATLNQGFGRDYTGSMVVTCK
jgi:ABC-type uncharacterized transport system substrate-binding protein